MPKNTARFSEYQSKHNEGAKGLRNYPRCVPRISVKTPQKKSPSKLGISKGISSSNLGLAAMLVQGGYDLPQFRHFRPGHFPWKS